ncbi:MAG: protein-glutamate methylesterase/protein-glutamine glutaminase [Pontibacterium sp.]
MKVRVLVVDDSGFFRHRIAEFLGSDPRLEVVGFASDGLEAVEKNQSLKPDVITMDIEMPRMNGIEAVKEVMRTRPTTILMLSSLTQEGATTTLKALDAGAADYMPKDMKEWLADRNTKQKQFCDKLLALSDQARRYPGRTAMVARPAPSPPAAPTISPTRSLGRRKEIQLTGLQRQSSVEPSRSGAQVSSPAKTRKQRPRLPEMPNCKLLVIGTSTGGPAALQKLLSALPANFPCPILLVQHMPKSFTPVFAARLDQQCRIHVKEAEDNDTLLPGCAYLAPGGCQMTLSSRGKQSLKVIPGDDRTTFKPSVDITYASAAKEVGKSVLAIILTGMGSDGTKGAQMLKRIGATVWAQDEESSTIFGMPKSVIEAKCADEVLSLDEITQVLASPQKGRGH